MCGHLSVRISDKGDAIATSNIQNPISQTLVFHFFQLGFFYLFSLDFGLTGRNRF